MHILLLGKASSLTRELHKIFLGEWNTYKTSLAADKEVGGGGCWVLERKEWKGREGRDGRDEMEGTTNTKKKTPPKIYKISTFCFIEDFCFLGQI